MDYSESFCINRTGILPSTNSDSGKSCRSWTVRKHRYEGPIRLDSASPSQHLVAPRLSLKVPTDAGRGQAKLMDNRRKHGTPPSYSRRGRKKALPEIDVVLYFKLKLQQQRSIYDMRKVFFFLSLIHI